jgi:hypothetical protein
MKCCDIKELNRDTALSCLWVNINNDLDHDRRYFYRYSSTFIECYRIPYGNLCLTKYIGTWRVKSANPVPTEVYSKTMCVDGYIESLKSDLSDAIEKQEQEQREEFNAGRADGLRYAILMLEKVQNGI